MSTFTTQRDRDAWNTIRGYVYQVDLTIERWLNLQPGQTLELECGEDIDIVSRSLTATPEERQRLLEQVKHRVSSITLKASEAVTAIACFIEHRQTNPSANLLFRFTTNTQVGKEKLSPMPKKGSAIVAWEEIRQGNLQGTAQNADLQGIRTILKNVKQPDKLHDDTWQIFCDFITNASDDRLLDLICSFEWSTKAPDAQSLSPSLQKLLVDRKHARDNIEAQEQYRRLFLYVFKLLCEPGIKQLTVEERSHQLSLPTLSETDHQLLNNVVVWVQALEVRVQEHEERLGVLEQHLDRERTETYIGQEVADCVDNLLRDYTKLFVGRETTLKQLDEFLAEKRNNLLTLIAPAGFGKTALLANWVASRQDDGCFIVYHFFSQRYDVTRSFSAAYRNLLRQLYDYYEPSDRQIPNNEDGLRDKLYCLLKEYSERDGRPLVIVLDALDEAEPPFRQFLPLLPENLFLIASARAEEGQEPEYLRGWTDNALPIRLNRLCRGAIADWIRQAGEGELAAFAEDTHFVAQLDEITQGFPLYLRYLTEELIQAQQGGEDVPVVLTRSPKEFGAYVQEQFKQLAQVEEIRRHREVQELFALLSVALGVLSEDDIQELTALNEWDLAALPWQVTRWFNIQTGFYSFAHPLLAKEFQGVLKRQASSAKDKLIRYCSRWQEHQRRYALRHYAEHLHEVKRWEELYAIARRKDFAATQREQLPNEPDLPLKTVQAALLGAAEKDDAGAMADFMLVHARRLEQTTVQESPLDALRSGSLDRALALADLYEIERCILWYLLLAWELKDRRRLEEAQAILQRLQQKELLCLPTRAAIYWQGDFAVYLLTHVFEISKDACIGLHQKLLNEDDCYHLLCNIFISHGDFTTAIETVQGMNSEREQVFMLEKIAKAQAVKRPTEEARTTFAKALEITRKPIPDSSWVCTMGAIAEAQIEIGDREAARTTFTEALETAHKIDNKWQRVSTFVALAGMQAEVEMFPEALDTLHRINGQLGLEDFLQARVLRTIAKVEAKAGNKDKARATFTSALKTALGIEDEDENRRVDALVDLARTQAEVREFASAIETAEEISNQWDKARALGEIVRMQVQAEDFAAALDTTSRIEEPSSKANALWGIAKAQAKTKPFTDDAVETAELIDNQVYRREALVAIAKEQAEAGNFPGALTTKSKIQGQIGQQNALSAIAKAYAKAGNFPAALKLTEQMPEELIRVRTIGEIAQVQVKVNQKTSRTTFATAIRTALDAKPEFFKALALADIAEIQVRIGQKETAATTARIAEDIVQRIDNSRKKAVIIALIAQVLANTGNRKEAKVLFKSATETAKKIDSQQEQVSSFRVIAEAQARVKEFPVALETARMIGMIKWLDVEAETLVMIAKEQVKVGQGEEAQQTVDTAFEIAQNYYSVWGSIKPLCTVTEAQAAVGDKETALDILTKLYEVVKESQERYRDLSTIAVTHVKIGELKTALEIADKIEDREERVRILSWIAWTQFKRGDKEEILVTLETALEAKDDIKDEQERMQVLSVIAGIQARAGNGKTAVRTVEKILNERNRHFPNLANIFLDTGDKANFKKLLIPCAYYLDAAYQMCGYLAWLYPEKAQEIAEVVSELN